MEVTLTTEQEAVLTGLAARLGRTADEAAQEALTEWVARQSTLAEFRATLDEAEASIMRGEGIDITRDAMTALSRDIKKSARAKVAQKALR